MTTNYVSQHDSRYVIARPGGLGVGAATGVVTVQEDGSGGSIQRADLASFLLRAATEPDFPHVKKAVGLSSTSGTGWVKENKEGFDKPSSL
jgi:hypothetical protein